MKLYTTLLNFIQLHRTLQTKAVLILHVDNARKLMCRNMEKYCKTQGIMYKKTILDSPPQNSVVEQTNLTIASMACVILIDADLSNYFWPFMDMSHCPHQKLCTTFFPPCQQNSF